MIEGRLGLSLNLTSTHLKAGSAEDLGFAARRDGEVERGREAAAAETAPGATDVSTRLIPRPRPKEGGRDADGGAEDTTTIGGAVG